ncbi:MAG TPA: ABC transporter permease subunit [Candidatus Pacearchaeota archaeon]|jgi:His/Glu/Gln/Arg/opine family amino acid ABC transporter permease subunit|nr:ABC transporter permease subunit [Candidatus Pacearchaeota archaeon]|tara:strand:+ start:1140 stop:1793 length:654 start_codon:yes stop_codon:yes gene_type:complete
MFEILIQYRHLFLAGFLTTIKLWALIILIGVPLGIFFGVVGGRYSKTVNRLVSSLKFVTKVIPVLVLLFWLHFPFQAILGVVIDPFWTTIIALGFVNLVAVAFIIQSELKLLPVAYSEAGTTLGMSKKQIVKHIELPILMKRVLPNISLNQATMLEYTLFASLISVPELFRVAQSINAMVYDPVSVYSLLVLFFVIILAPLHLFITWYKKRSVIEYD